jgi:hypothetical protein
MLTSEQECLLMLARETWTRRGSAKTIGLAYNEETITETMLLNLKLRYPGEVTIIAFNKAEEAECGADWMWTFLSADEQSSITMIVQAKRLDNDERAYAGIKRSVGARMPPVRQIDRLLATAQKYSVPPVYAFYNHLRDHTRIKRSCGTLPDNVVEQIEGWGISLASGHAVAAALPDEGFDRHVHHSIPLHCMLCTGGRGTYGADGSPGAVATSLTGAGGPTGGGSGTREYRPSSELHPVVEFARRFSSESKAEIGDMLKREFPDLAGMVILRDAKRQDAEVIDRPPPMEL